MTGHRALIVDDNATNRLILMRQIEPWGMSGRDTPSGREALEWVRAGESFDIAVLDVRMPEMDGMTLARELNKLCPDLPLVILTSMGRREPELSELNIAAFLVKPIKRRPTLPDADGLPQWLAPAGRSQASSPR